MMRLAEIEAHIAGMGELLNIVAAMRSLAGMRMQEAQSALPGIRSFADAVAGGIADARLLIADGRPPPPTMKFFGLWSLNRNGSPGSRTLNVRPPLGCQKFTSSGF